LPKVLIAGATGVIGEAALDHFSALPDWNIVALSRRIPKPATAGLYQHVKLDLTDAQACRSAAPDLRDVTHLIYTAVSEAPGLGAGWKDPQRMEINAQMLRNLVEPLCALAPALRHVTLLQGAKAYGGHAGFQSPLPAREDAPRVPHENFYWLQEDYIRAKAQETGFGWTIFRPQVLIGAAWGVAMNPLLPVAAYAAIRREEGKPFSYPGGSLQVGELVDATLLAQAFAWAADAPSASNQIFNITNGDVFSWREAWPAIAAAFGAPTGADEPLRLAEYLPPRAHIWEDIVARKNLRPIALLPFLGESHHYIDMLLRYDSTKLTRPTLLSTIKLRQAGFAPCCDSVASIVSWIGKMQERRLIPAEVLA
jgi:nucleoside-diphosphate-sugar epimerase